MAENIEQTRVHRDSRSRTGDIKYRLAKAEQII
jgi:hypothetical protein